MMGAAGSLAYVETGCDRAVRDALHELAQPLMAISFASEIALMNEDSAEWRKALQTVVDQSRRAAESLDRVRGALQRPEACATTAEV